MENISINIKEKKEYFIPLLEESGWDIVKKTVESSQFDEIIIKLVDQVNKDKRFTPIYKDIFNAFLECPYEKLKVVFVSQNPYPKLNVADGISFSCSYTKKEEPFLKYIFDEIEKTVYSPLIGEKKSKLLRPGYNPDLKRWSNQGILMLNTALTSQIGKIDSHYSIWKLFMTYLFDCLNQRNDLIFVLMGQRAEEWEIKLNNNKIIKVSHPATAGYGYNKWDSNDLFNKVNEYLKSQEKSTIIW